MNKLIKSLLLILGIRWLVKTRRRTTYRVNPNSARKLIDDYNITGSVEKWD